MSKRLLSFCFGVLLGVSGFVYGQAVTPQNFWSSGGPPYRVNSEYESICREAIAAAGSSYLYDRAEQESATTAACYYKTASGASNRFSTVRLTVCPSGKPYFTAPGMYQAWDGGCSNNVPPPKSCSKGSPGTGSWAVPPPGMPGPMQTGGCVSGCTVQMTDVKSCKNEGGTYSAWESGKPTYCEFAFETTGAQCTPGPGMPGTEQAPGSMPRADQVPKMSPPPGGSCPKGTVQAGSDSAGTPICMGTGSDPKNSPPPPPKVESEKTTQNADGSTTKTTTTTTTNSDGSTTTVTNNVTTMPNGSTKTDTSKDTSKTPTGTPGKDESTRDNEKYDLCKQNPMLTICRNSSVTGKCGEITCEGDAIQCATLRAAAAMRCEQEADKEALKTSPLKTMGQNILDGVDPMKGSIDTALKGREVDMSKQALDESGFVGGGSCFPEKTITVFGKTVVVSFARVCQDIQPLRAAIMACAFIVAYLIVSKSVLQG
jgi:hypothetical protein